MEYIDLWHKKYVTLRANAPKRGVLMKLTFAQYKRLAKRAGITDPEQIGNKPGKFQMGRKGDKGNYEWGNCRFITLEQNREEQHQNGGNIRGALKRKGYTKDNRPAIAAMAEDFRTRSKKTHAYIRRRAKKVSKGFVAFSPEGKKYTGVNLTEFCEKHGLSQGNMSNVCRGTREHYKGWTVKYVERRASSSSSA